LTLVVDYSLNPMADMPDTVPIVMDDTRLQSRLIDFNRQGWCIPKKSVCRHALPRWRSSLTIEIYHARFYCTLNHQERPGRKIFEHGYTCSGNLFFSSSQPWSTRLRLGFLERLDGSICNSCAGTRSPGKLRCSLLALN
jgi:hypothetical protein